MIRRDFLVAFGGASATLAAGAWTAANAAAEEPLARRPDVLFILTDQWNPRCLPFAGDAAVVAPNIASIAEEGVIFDNCYTPCPVCTPARASLLSGLYPHNHNIFGNLVRYYIPPAIASMFQDIRRAGYTTCQVGKHHWTEDNGWEDAFDSIEAYYDALGLDDCREVATPFTTPEDPGVYQDHLREIDRLDAYCRDIAHRVVQGQYVPMPSAVGPEDHNDTFVANTAIEFLERQPVGKPYCLVVSFPGPHPPMDACGKYAELIPPGNIELPPNVPDSYEYDGFTYDRDAMRRLRASYYGKMALIDDNIGRIVAFLRQRGTWNDTLLIFSSDHGEMMGAHGHMSKGRFFEESVRVPLVMRWPGRIPPGTRTPALTQLFDIYPTIVEAIGGELSPGHFAVSQLPVATGNKKRVRDAVFSEIGKEPPLNFMVRTDRYVWWTHRGEEALYDLEADPFQMNNLIASPAHQDALDEIRMRHLRYFMETQYNLSADYVSRLARMKQEVGKDSEGLEGRLYQLFRKNVWLD